MNRTTVISPGEYYHVYNRGTEKRVIFETEKDHKRFMALLYICNGNIPVDIKRQGWTLSELIILDRGVPLVDIVAYCLMPNHFHLIIKEIKEGGTSLFMQKLSTGYTMYFNKTRERSGALFQGKYKATHITDDVYFKHLFSYLHLNPVKIIEPKWKEVGIQNRILVERYLEGYSYSSYFDYVHSDRLEKCIINKTSMPSFCKTQEEFKKLIVGLLDDKVGPWPRQKKPAGG